MAQDAGHRNRNGLDAAAGSPITDWADRVRAEADRIAIREHWQAALAGHGTGQFAPTVPLTIEVRVPLDDRGTMARTGAWADLAALMPQSGQDQTEPETGPAPEKSGQFAALHLAAPLTQPAPTAPEQQDEDGPLDRPAFRITEDPEGNGPADIATFPLTLPVAPLRPFLDRSDSRFGQGAVIQWHGAAVLNQAPPDHLQLPAHLRLDAACGAQIWQAYGHLLGLMDRHGADARPLGRLVAQRIRRTLEGETCASALLTISIPNGTQGTSPAPENREDTDKVREETLRLSALSLDWPWPQDGRALSLHDPLCPDDPSAKAKSLITDHQNGVAEARNLTLMGLTADSRRVFALALDLASGRDHAGPDRLNGTMTLSLDGSLLGLGVTYQDWTGALRSGLDRHGDETERGEETIAQTFESLIEAEISLGRDDLWAKPGNQFCSRTYLSGNGPCGHLNAENIVREVTQALWDRNIKPASPLCLNDPLRLDDNRRADGDAEDDGNGTWLIRARGTGRQDGLTLIVVLSSHGQQGVMEVLAAGSEDHGTLAREVLGLQQDLHRRWRAGNHNSVSTGPLVRTPREITREITRGTMEATAPWA